MVNPATGPADQLASKTAAAQMLASEPLHFDHRLARVTGDWLSKPGSAPDQNCASAMAGNAPPQRVGQYALPSQRAHFAHRQKHLLAALLAIQRAVAAVADAVEIQKMPVLDFRQLQWFTHVCLCSFKKSGRAVVSHLRQLPGVVTLIPRPSGFEHRKTLPAICRALSSRGARNSRFATSDFSSPSGSSMA